MTDQKTKTPVLIAVAMRRFRKADDLPMHLRMLLGELRARDLPWSFEMMIFGGGNVARGRNKIVADFLRGEWKWISFLDDDIGEEDDPAEAAKKLADALIQILSHRLHVCGALYTTKDREGPHWVLNTFREPEIDSKGLLVVPELGTGGFKTYHRTVFETLVKKEPGLSYSCDDTANPEWGFFCMGLMDVDGKRRWLPEDFWLDQICRKHGIPVHVDTTIKLRHRGPDGTMFPVDDAWPRMPGPTKEIKPPATASDFPPASWNGRLIIALQYWGGDKKQALSLARFIADLEPEYRDDVELMFVKRHDTGFDHDTANYVRQKMRVSFLIAPEHVPGYPQSPNIMAESVIIHASETMATTDNAVFLMEADCIPVAKDWINQIREEWSRARAAGRLLMGSWRPECSDLGHINGNCVISPMLYHTTKPAPLGKKAWDIHWVKEFSPHWCRTGLIRNRYKEAYLPEGEMAVPECGSRPPVLVHGIKTNEAHKYAEKMTGVKFHE